MKQTLDSRTVVPQHHRPLKWWAMGAVAAVAATKLLVSPVAAQGPYYPVTNPNGTLGGISANAANYTGTPVTTIADSNYLQSILQQYYGPNVTLEAALLVPPTTYTFPTPAQYQAAVAAATITILGGVAPTPVAPPPPGVTLLTFARQAVDSNYNNRSQIVQSIAASIISASGAPTTDLSNLIGTLGASSPGGIQLIAQGVFNAAVKSTATINAIPSLAAKALSFTLGDTNEARGVIDWAVQSISAAPPAVLANAAAKTNFYLNTFIPGLLTDPSLNGLASHDTVFIDTAVGVLTRSSGLNLAPLASILTKVASVLPAPTGGTTADQQRGAITIGALRTVGLSQAPAVKTAMATPYTDAVVDGYSATSATFATVLNNDKTHADAIAWGALLRSAVSPQTVVQSALSSGFGQVNADPFITASRIIAAVVAGNPIGSVMNTSYAITAPLFAQYGPALLTGTTDGSIRAANQGDFGSIISNILIKVQGVAGAYTSANINSILNQSINAAYGASHKGGVTDLVWETVQRTRLTPGLTGPAVTQAINSIAAVDGTKPAYLAVVAGLVASNTVSIRNEVLQAAFGSDGVPGGPSGALIATGSDEVAANYGKLLVVAAQTTPGTTYTEALKTFHDAEAGGSPNGVLAGIYGAILLESVDAEAVVAAAIRQSSVSSSALQTAASDAVRGIDAGRDIEVQLAARVATELKTIPSNRSRILDYIGREVIADPTRAYVVATAATVVDPNAAHYVTEAVAFNNPLNTAPSVKAIFKYAQITSASPFIYATVAHGDNRAILDQPGAAAAITAGLTTGILEARLSNSDAHTAMVTGVTAAVVSSITQQGKALLGQTQPFFNNGGDTSSFRQSNGTTWNGATPIVTGTVRTVGAAGAVTGYMAQVTSLGATSLLMPNEPGTVANSITAAVLRAAAVSASAYVLEIAQAAGQAFGWVSGTNTGAAADAVALQIAQAIIPSGTLGGKSQTEIFNAARFGLAEAAAGTIGAGALGLNATGLQTGTTSTLVVKASGNANASFYLHRSAAGTPVTDIFNL